MLEHYFQVAHSTLSSLTLAFACCLLELPGRPPDISDITSSDQQKEKQKSILPTIVCKCAVVLSFTTLRCVD